MTATEVEPTTTVHARTCPLCEATCGLEITMKGDQIGRIRGDQDDVFSHGFICPKGSTVKQLHEDPDRLRVPLVKRDGEWHEASWDEAFAAIEEGLLPLIEQHGRDAVAIYLGNPSVHNHAPTLYGRPLIMALSTKNIFSASTVDQMPKHVSAGYMFGDGLTIPVPDLDRTDYLLMLGANPWHSNGSLCTAPDFPGRLEAIRERGGRFVVVDPRRTRTAEEADEHLFIRPGTDPHWLFALAHTLFDEDLVDVGDLADHLVGLDELRPALEAFTPEAVAPICGIDAETTRRIARELAGAPTAAVYGRIGTHTAEFGTLCSWMVDVLNVLTGNLDQPGGAMFAYPAHGSINTGVGGGRGFSVGRHHSRVKGYPEVRREFPIATLADEIETPGDGQVRALLTVAGNPALSAPNSGRLSAALASLDFMVSIDPYLNETTRHADVILPPPSSLSKSHSDLAFYGLSVRNIANYSPALIHDDGPDDAEILARLALVVSGQGATSDPAIIHGMVLDSMLQRAVGREGSPVFGRDPAELAAMLGDRAPADKALDVMLRTGPYGDQFGAVPDGLSLDKLEANPHGIDLGPLTPQIPGNLRTESGQVEVAPQPILDDIPRLAASLDQHRNGTFVLVGRRHVRSNNSWMHNINVLVKGKDRCTLHVHPDDAVQLGLTDGGQAVVASRVGKLEAPVEVTDDILRGVVSLPHGWGHSQPGIRMEVAEAHAGVNSNILTDESCLDPLSGNAVLNAIPVTVAPANVA
jgi:anaerobic selenocysteine-containing dehydrogenase